MPKNKLLTILIGFVTVFTVSVLITYISSLFAVESNLSSNINLNIRDNWWRIILPLLLSPILEELIFRKWMPNTFDDITSRLNIIVLSNIIFALLHFDTFIPYFINGIIYSYFYEKTNDIKITIAIHILYNLSVFLLTFSL